MSHHLIICGAGAAGLTAAIYAAEAGARVTLLERSDKAGKKILMSGGTRCNVLPLSAVLDDYHTSSSKNLLRRVFKSWSLEACKDWFTDELGLELACENESNKWFPKSNSAKEVRDKLLQKALAGGVELRYKSGVKALQKQENGQWTAELEHGGSISGDAIIVATGGLSIPTTGTTGMGHDFLAELGHTTGPVYPALTPLKTDSEPHKALAGISLEVGVEVHRAGKKQAESARSGFLFTHRGYSGPAVLDISHHHRAELRGSDAITCYAIWEGIP
ncbi:MAG: aminoacetone oxidase family FAD-binding enzyme, partial [Cyclonatronaceae bacterium]